MSSYFTSYSDVVLRLNYDETQDMLKRYLQKHNIHHNVEELLDCYGERGENEYQFFKSTARPHKDFIKYDELNISFYASFYLSSYTDDIEGASIILFEKDPDDKNYIWDDIKKDDFWICCKKSILPQALLSEHTYSSIDEIIQEFQSSLKDYLPADFNYKAHIGLLSYASYA